MNTQCDCEGCYRMLLQCIVVYVTDYCISCTRLHVDYTPLLSPDVHTQKGC